MATLSAISCGNVGAAATGEANAFDVHNNGDLETIAAAQDGDYGEVTTNATGNYADGYLLDNMPADFETMDSLNVRLRYGWSATPTNTTWDRLDARVVKESDGTVLAAATAGGSYKAVAANITATTPTNSSTIAFDYVNTTATKADWDDANLQIKIVRTRSKGGGSQGQRVYAGEISGAYTQASSDVNVAANAEALTLTEFQASIAFDVDVQANAEALTLTEFAAAIDFGVNVQAAAESLTLTENTASITYDVDVQSAAEALTLTEFQASIALDVDVAAGAESLTLTENSASVVYDVDVGAAAESLTLTESPASIAYDVEVQAAAEALTITEFPATVSVGGGDVEVLAAVESLTLTEFQAGVALDVDIQAAVEALSITEFPATVDLAGGDVEVNAATEALTITPFAATIAATSARRRAPGGWLPTIYVREDGTFHDDAGRSVDIDGNPVPEPVTVAAAIKEATRNAPRATKQAARRVLPALRRADMAALAAEKVQKDLDLILIEFRQISALAEAAIRQWLEDEEDEERAIELLLLAA